MSRLIGCLHSRYDGEYKLYATVRCVTPEANRIPQFFNQVMLSTIIQLTDGSSRATLGIEVNQNSEVALDAI